MLRGGCAKYPAIAPVESAARNRPLGHARCSADAIQSYRVLQAQQLQPKPPSSGRAHTVQTQRARSTLIFTVLIVTAGVLIPVRAFLLSAAVFHPPRAREKIMKIWPFLLPFDELWSLSPFLLLHHINFGLALACTALLVYSPFAQRSLVLMSAGDMERKPPQSLSEQNESKVESL